MEVSSVKELAAVISKSNQTVKMTPGVYKMKDYVNSSVIAAAPLDGVNRKAMLLFSGDNNTFDFTGVTIEIDTKLLAAFKTSINEIQITGSGNTLTGLTITDIGNSPPAGKGARSFVITGDSNTVDGITLNMGGSAPYGYGDLLGKGKGSVVALRKHSGLLVEGKDINVLNCSIYSKSFGHLFFVQGGRNVRFENCYAEGVMRSTDEMLAEKSGPAFKANFESSYKNRNGDKKITAGYVKSLNECGFRNYGTGGPDKNKTGAITLVNCRAKNTRIGFAFTRIDEDMTIEGCDAQGCEVAYYIGGANVKSSRGDAENGPLLILNKATAPSTIDLELMPATSSYIIHCLAAINGTGHKINLSNYEGKMRNKELPILIGQNGPPANNGYSPMGKVATSGIEFTNTTGMPIELNELTSQCTVTSNGKVSDNGTSNKETK